MDSSSPGCAHFEYSRWVSRVSQPVQRTPLWPASWLPVLDKRRGSKSAEVQRFGVIYDGRLQFMTRDDALGLDEALRSNPRPGVSAPNAEDQSPSSLSCSSPLWVR